MNMPSTDLVVIGLREGIELYGKEITADIYKNSWVVNFYGIPVRVAAPTDLIDMKEYAAVGRISRNKPKDKEDIRSLRNLV